MIEPEDISKLKKGKILHTSWGYDQTNNEYCEILENTGKTIKCQKLGKRQMGDISPAYGMQVAPDRSNRVCKPFRIRISKYKYGGEDRVSLVGSFPLSKESCDHKITGYWGDWDEKPDVDTER